MIRQTRQRAAILDAMRQAQRPLTPAELYDQARSAHPSLGLRTVYRQIKDLTASGEIVGVDYPGQPTRYELRTGRHQAHFICRRCGHLYAWDFDVPDVDVTAPPGYQLDGQETIFYGTCPSCGRR